MASPFEIEQAVHELLDPPHAPKAMPQVPSNAHFHNDESPDCVYTSRLFKHDIVRLENLFKF